MTTKAEQLPRVPPSKILVCDDDHDTRNIVLHSITALGHEVIEASGGQQAIDHCKLSLPDAVVMDIMMPDVTGHDFLRWFKEFHVDTFIPVLFLTALTEVDNRVEGLEMGADDYLTKPFNYRELQARVTALLRIKALTDNLIQRRIEIEDKNEQLSRMQQELIKKERQLVAMQLAGAAAHNLGQPVTTILLNCSILEKSLTGDEQPLLRAKNALQAVRQECEEIKAIASELNRVDPERTENYLEDVSIISLKGK